MIVGALRPCPLDLAALPDGCENGLHHRPRVGKGHKEASVLVGIPATELVMFVPDAPADVFPPTGFGASDRFLPLA